VAEDLTGDTVCGVRLHRRGHVGVDLPGDVSGRVVEPVAHDLDVDALLKRQSRPCVAEPVQHEAGERFVWLARLNCSCLRWNSRLNRSGWNGRPSAIENTSPWLA
jgi:hypothetical protein